MRILKNSTPIAINSTSATKARLSGSTIRRPTNGRKPTSKQSGPFINALIERSRQKAESLGACNELIVTSRCERQRKELNEYFSGLHAVTLPFPSLPFPSLHFSSLRSFRLQIARREPSQGALSEILLRTQLLLIVDKFATRPGASLRLPVYAR